MFKDSYLLNDIFFSPFVGGREMRHLESHVLIGCLDTSEDHQLALRAGLRLSLFKFWLAEYWQTRKQVAVILEIACGHHKNTQKYVFPSFFFFSSLVSHLCIEKCASTSGGFETWRS